jgi:hypothetical protein
MIKFVKWLALALILWMMICVFVAIAVVSWRWLVYLTTPFSPGAIDVF